MQIYLLFAILSQEVKCIFNAQQNILNKKQRESLKMHIKELTIVKRKQKYKKQFTGNQR